MRLNYPEPFVPFADGFPTASGKLEFLSERMAKAGLDPLAGYTPPHEAAQRDTLLAERYPLALIAGADHYFLNSLFANVPDQVKRSGPPVIRIHPQDATARGLETGYEARVFNDRGAFVALVEVTDRVRRGVVASTKGRWPRSVTGGATVNATVAERDSDMGGGAVFHDNRVEVERLAGPGSHLPGRIDGER
jgi:anaerobic selenocysteine-containing dehydrogenase